MFLFFCFGWGSKFGGAVYIRGRFTIREVRYSLIKWFIYSCQLSFPLIYSKSSVFCIITVINAGVNGSLEVTLLKGRQAFDVDSTSNLGVAKIITWWILDVFYLGKSESSPYFLQEEVNLCLIFFGLWWILNVYFTCRSERSSNEKNPACERASNVFARSSSRVRVRCSHLFWLVSISFLYVLSTIIQAANGRL